MTRELLLGAGAPCWCHEAHVDPAALARVPAGRRARRRRGYGEGGHGPGRGEEDRREDRWRAEVFAAA